MGRIKKKGTAGQAKNFITRSQAIRKLQISLPDFRRLCIFKGCYPREPRSRKKVSKSTSATFYYTKDIQYLLHEPLLDKFRDHKALAKKIARCLGRGDLGDAARLEKKHTPKISLDHIIKERYPTFVDALRDLDDALSMLFLFANLPATSTVPPKTIARCQRLCHEFQHYLITTHSLRKSFLSIKGIYYQATIQGQDILWLVPYKFVQRITSDVDFRIMGTFIEFYSTLLGFINLRLYTSIGLIYPPKFNAKSDSEGGELSAFVLEGRAVDSVPTIDAAPSNGVSEPDPDLQKRVDDMDLSHQPNPDIEPDQNEDPSNAESTAEVDTFTPTAPDADTLPQPSQPSTDLATLFSSLSVFLSRETPRHPLEFLLRAFGCKRVSWNAVLGDGAFTNDEFDPSITHQVVDRPPPASTSETPEQEPGKRMPNRTYIQPQWVWDCVNEGRLLRPDLYAPGATLPPHLSPWVKPSKGAYDPTASLEIQEQEGEAEEALLLREELEEDDEAEPAAVGAMDVDSETEHANGNGMSIAAGDSDTASEKSMHSSFGGFSEPSDAESDTSAGRHQRELEAEAAGLTFTETKAAPKGILKNTSQTEADMRKRQALAKKRKANDEEILEGRKMMMSRRARKLYERADHGNKDVEMKAAKLRQKRRKREGRIERQ